MVDMATRLAILETEFTNLKEDYQDLKKASNKMNEAIQQQCRAIGELKNTLRTLGKAFVLVCTLGPSIGVAIAKWIG